MDVQANIEDIIKRTAALTPSPSKASDLDAIGTELWNITTCILRDAEESGPVAPIKRDTPTRATVLLRTFAFYLLDAAYHASQRRTKDAEQRLRNFKLALKTCRYCLDNDELELAMRVLERCSDHASAVDDASPLVRLTEDGAETEQRAKLRELAVEFYLLRIMHQWKSGRLDLATHFTGMLNMQAARSTNLPERAADLFYEIGRSVLKQPNVIAATEWLERAAAMLDACDVEHLSDDAAGLRLSISAKLGITALHRLKAQRLIAGSEMPYTKPNPRRTRSRRAHCPATEARPDHRKSSRCPSHGARLASCKDSCSA